jgi:hypothetical protein
MNYSNRDYILQRIRKLGGGTFMVAFQWKNGGDWISNGTLRAWTSDLPTDSELLMHIFCTFLDEQLASMTATPLDRPFTRKYFVPHGQQADPSQSDIQILQLFREPPHFRLVISAEKQRSATSTTAGTATTASSASTAQPLRSVDIQMSDSSGATTTAATGAPSSSEVVVWDPIFGSANVFETLVLFLYAIRQYFRGYVAQLYLGNREIGLLQVLEA